MSSEKLPSTEGRTAFDLHALIPPSLSCGDESQCNAHPARTARRIVMLCLTVAVVAMTAMLLANLR